MARTETGQVGSARTEVFDKNLLINTYPFRIHDRFGQVTMFPKRTGNTIKFRRYGTLAVKTTALTEGTTPTSDQLSVSDLTAQLSRYGGYVELTDDVVEENVESVQAETSELQGPQAGRTVDQLYRDVIVAGTSVQYSDGTSRGEVNSNITTALVKKVIRTLANNNAIKLTSILKATDKVGTLAVGAGYWGIMHPDVWYTFQDLTGVQKVKDYSSSVKSVENELGSYDGVRFIESTDAKVFADTGGTTTPTSFQSTSGMRVDVYGTMIFAKHAYGLVPLQAEGRKMGKTNIKFITHGLGHGDDPLEQRMTMGWKAKTVAKILNDNFMVRLETAAAA